MSVSQKKLIIITINNLQIIESSISANICWHESG